MPDRDLSFGFDPKPFTNGIKTVTQQLTRLSSQTSRTAQNMGKAVFRATLKMELLKSAIRGATRILGQMGKYMPEITKVFEASKEIILRNFLWPIRQAIAPILQNILDWVRDNRAMFVKWGQAVVSIFKAVVVVADKLWKLIRSIADSILPMLSRTLGLAGKTATDIINLILAKMATLLIYLTRLLKPIADEIGRVIEAVLPKAIELFQGLISRAGDVMAALGGIWTQIKGIVSELFGAEDFFTNIGGLISDVIAGGLRVVEGLLTGIRTGLEGIGTPLNNVIARFREFIRNLTTANESGHSIVTVFQTIGEVVGKMATWVTTMTSKFLDGFVPAVRNIMTPIQKIVDAFQDIFDLIFGSDEAMKGWGDLFETLGKKIGETLTKALEGLAKAVEDIVNIIEWIQGIKTGETRPFGAEARAEREEWYEDMGGKEGVIDALRADPSVGVKGVPFLDRALDKLFPRARGVKDAIIKPDGTVIETDPQDTIIATKNGFGMGPINQTVNIQLTVTEGSAKAAGFNFADGMQSGLRGEILDSMVAGGY